MKPMYPPIYHHKCMSCHEAIVVITGRAHWFHDCIYIYIMLILLLGNLSTLCDMDHNKNLNSELYVKDLAKC